MKGLHHDFIFQDILLFTNSKFAKKAKAKTINVKITITKVLFKN